MPIHVPWFAEAGGLIECFDDTEMGTLMTFHWASVVTRVGGGRLAASTNQLDVSRSRQSGYNNLRKSI